jgi:hypothetical protein
VCIWVSLECVFFINFKKLAYKMSLLKRGRRGGGEKLTSHEHENDGEYFFIVRIGGDVAESHRD